MPGPASRCLYVRAVVPSVSLIRFLRVRDHHRVVLELNIFFESIVRIIAVALRILPTCVAKGKPVLLRAGDNRIV